jgi:hypothetical protein
MVSTACDHQVRESSSGFGLTALIAAATISLAACGHATATPSIASPSSTSVSSPRAASPIPSAVATATPVACPSQDRPSGRTSAAAGYMPSQLEVVVFGGLDSSRTSLGDTWLWKGGCWSRLNPALSPAARYDSNAAFDAAHRVMVLYGGFSQRPGQLVSRLHDTWLWDGGTWTEASTTGPDLVAPAATYDPANQRVVLFGTNDFGQAQTWMWDGSHWQQSFPTASPEARDSASMGFDSSSQRVLLFGGFGTQHEALNDTWTWDGSAWIQRHPSASPSARGFACMTSFSIGHTLLVVGGFEDPTILADAWTWDGSKWSRVSSAHSTGPLADAVAVDIGDRVFVFGGTDGAVVKNDVWIWDGADWAIH